MGNVVVPLWFPHLSYSVNITAVLSVNTETIFYVLQLNPTLAVCTVYVAGSKLRNMSFLLN